MQQMSFDQQSLVEQRDTDVISIDSAEVTSTAGAIRGFANDLQGIVNELSDLAKGSSEVWANNAGDSFRNQAAKVQASLSEFIKAINADGNWLEEIAQGAQSTTDSIAATFE